MFTCVAVCPVTGQELLVRGGGGGAEIPTLTLQVRGEGGYLQSDCW